jgi:uncharacterized protein YciI
MFIVSLHYTAPLARIDELLAAHRAFLDKQYARGLFLMSGRKVPRDGGVIVAQAASRAELEDVLREDPFQQAGVAHYEITEFVPVMTAEPLAAYRAA